MLFFFVLIFLYCVRTINVSYAKDVLMRLLVYVSLRYKSLLGDNGKRGTPDTIPNSEVKPFIYTYCWFQYF